MDLKFNYQLLQFKIGVINGIFLIVIPVTKCPYFLTNDLDHLQYHMMLVTSFRKSGNKDFLSTRYKTIN